MMHLIIKKSKKKRKSKKISWFTTSKNDSNTSNEPLKDIEPDNEEIDSDLIKTSSDRIQRLELLLGLQLKNIEKMLFV